MNWSQKYTCHRCEVTWEARVDENVPDTCWLCLQNDMTSVWTQAGKPVLIHTGNQSGLSSQWRQWEEDTRRSSGALS